MWKDFFYFSKNQRRGIYGMFILIGLAVAGNYLLPFFKSGFILSPKDQEEVDEFTASIHGKEKYAASPHYSNNKYNSRRNFPNSSRFREVPASELFLFDPNTADSLEFARLGLRPFVIRNILRYRAKKGKFRAPTEFSKIYGLTARQYRLLLPYITIGEEFRTHGNRTYASKAPSATPATFVPSSSEDEKRRSESSKNKTKTFKYPEGTLISLNEADTTELKKIPGIGKVFARRIVAYRNRLGGFYNTAQLQEIKNIPAKIAQWFYISAVPLRRLNINKASVERMYAHPYINFYQAKAIAEYRKKRGSLQSLKQLSLCKEFTEKDLERISHYVEF